MVTAHNNQKVMLPCEVEGEAAPSVLWKKDGIPLLFGNRYIDIFSGRVRGFGLDLFIMAFYFYPNPSEIRTQLNM